MIRRPPRSTLSSSSAASDVYKRQCKVFTQCPADFKNQIGNPDIVIVFTGTVAHKMVRVASGQAEKSGAIIKHCNSSSACALNDALTECFCKAV